MHLLCLGSSVFVIVLPLTHWQGGYDLTIGTSERGTSVDKVDEMQPFRWVCGNDACEMGLTSGANHIKDIRTYVLLERLSLRRPPGSGHLVVG